jgi:MFS family permease
VIWSVTSFVFEVPSGAWADTVDRRRLLVLSAAIYAAAFASWVVFPSFLGFAAGFVLWGSAGP